jgi:hypothetical protein
MSLVTVCVVRSLSRAGHSSRGVLLTVMCITEYDREASVMRKSWPTKDCCAMKKGSDCMAHCTR